MITRAIGLQRLYQQRITQNPLPTPAEVVAWMGAVQAQDYLGAKWALGLRMLGNEGSPPTDEAIEQAFNQGAILRTHVMRPTWHFVTPADIRWMLELTAPRVNAGIASRYRQLELDEALFADSNAIIAKALEGGQHLTRAELGSALARAGILAEGVRLSHIALRAELDGVVCSGPRRGKQLTYALLEERAPQARVLKREEALAELTRRYYTSHGPANVQDFAWWSGLTLAEVKAGLAMSASHLIHEELNGQTYWLSPSTPSVKLSTPEVYLLPSYDEFTVAYQDRSAVIDPAHLQQARYGILDPTIVIDGQVTGTWKRTLQRDSVTIIPNPFRPLSEAENEALAEAARRYGEFLGLPAML